MRKTRYATVVALALAGAMMVSSVALGAVTFDAETGEGFVGKGDVQLVFGWNNKALQDNADGVEFQLSTETVITWICRHSNPQAADQERNTTTSTQGLLESAARERNQVTGFNLEGFDGDPDVDTEGDEPNTCTGQRTYLEGSTEVTEGDTQVQVRHPSVQSGEWITLG